MGKDKKGNNLGKGISQDKSGKYRVRLKVSIDYKIDRIFDTLREAKSFLEIARYEGMIHQKNSETWFFCVRKLVCQ